MFTYQNKQRGEIHLAVILCATLLPGQQRFQLLRAVGFHAPLQGADTGMMDCQEDEVAFSGSCVRRVNTEQSVSLTAIAHAIYRATGVWHRELPITPEKIAMSLAEK